MLNGQLCLCWERVLSDTYNPRNRNNPRGLLRRRLLSDKQAGFRRKPAQKILKIMCALGVEDVFKAIWFHKLVSNSISSIHEYFIGDV